MITKLSKRDNPLLGVLYDGSPESLYCIKEMLKQARNATLESEIKKEKLRWFVLIKEPVKNISLLVQEGQYVVINDFQLSTITSYNGISVLSKEKVNELYKYELFR